MPATRHAQGRPVHREMFRAAAPPRRSRLSLLLSLLLHASAAALANLGANNPAVSRPDALSFVAAQAPPGVLLEPNVPEPLAETRPEPEPLIAPDLPKPALEFVRPEPEPAREPAPAPEHQVAAVAEPPPPAVELELSGGGRQVAETAQAGEAGDSGFDREVVQAPPLMVRNTAVGVFDLPSDTPRPGRERPAATVTSAGFGGPTREPAPVRPRRGVVTGLAGFGASPEAASPAPGARQEVVTGVAGFGAPAAPEAKPPSLAQAAMASGFEVDLPDAPAAGAAVPTGPPDAPVEIEFKPTPEYSAEARAAGIEGNVSLEVEFSAAGVVRVLRVIEGLGHGLDARAVRAAEQMRFTPAVRNGQRVDTRAVVSIVFRLA